jgi:hypothetical protein
MGLSSSNPLTTFLHRQLLSFLELLKCQKPATLFCRLAKICRKPLMVLDVSSLVVKKPVLFMGTVFAWKDRYVKKHAVFFQQAAK